MEPLRAGSDATVGIEPAIEQLAWAERADAAVDRRWRRHEEQSGEIGNRLRISREVDSGNDTKRSDLARKRNGVLDECIEERLDPEPIAREE
jgi:hypothetical protein